MKSWKGLKFIISTWFYIFLALVILFPFFIFKKSIAYNDKNKFRILFKI